MNLRKITTRIISALTAGVMVITNLPTGIVFAEVGSWTNNSDGSYSYTQGNDPTAAINHPLTPPSDIDWSTIQYVSVDVEADSTLMPVIGGKLNSVWTNGNAVWMQDGGNATVYFATGGNTVSDLTLGFWGVDGNGTIAATGTTITLSNITFSENAMPDPVGTWFEKDNKLCYQNGSNDSSWINLDLIQYAADNSYSWTDTKYVSATVECVGEAAPEISMNFTGDDTGWEGTGKVTIKDSSAELVFATDGRTPNSNYGGASITFETLPANVLVKISDITFHTTYSGLTNAWYEDNNAWYYQNGNSDITTFNSLKIDTNGVDWSTIKYVSAYVETAGKANPVFGGNVETNNNWKSGDSVDLDGNGATIYWKTDGTTLVDLYVGLWPYDDDGTILTANQLIKVSNITFHTSYQGIKNAWYEEDGTWYYQNDSSVDNWQGFDLLQYASDNSLSWTDTRYISATVECSEEMTTYLSVQFSDDSWKEDSGELGVNSVELYCETKGETPKGAGIAVENLPAGAVIKISNITFSDEAKVVYDQWFEADDGVWKYVDSGNGWQDGDSSYPLVFNDYMDIDLTGAKYVSAKITVDGMAVSGFGGNNDNGTHYKRGSFIENVDRENTSYFFCYEGGYTNLSYGLFDIGEGTTITLSDLHVSTTDLTNYTDITGQVVQIGENSYYFKNLGLNGEWFGNTGLDLQLLPDDVDISDVQTISMKLKSAKVATSVQVGGWTSENRLVQGYGFNATSGGYVEHVVERKYRGWIARGPVLSVLTNEYEEVYISDIIFDKTPIETVYTNPNDILIDDNVVAITDDWYVMHGIGLDDLSKMEVSGTLKVKVELIDGYEDPYIWPHFQDYGDASYTPVYGWTALIPEKAELTEDGYFEFRIEQKYIDLIQELWSKRYVDGFGGLCSIGFVGYGITVSDVIFTPDPTIEEPKQEEIKADKITQDDKQKLEQSKNNTHDEKDAKDKVKNGKPQGHKYHKKDKHGRDIYSLRIVKMVDKDLLKNAKDVSITVYSKKANKYVTFTADCCFSYLNIYGEKVKAGGDHAFLTVIVDNVQADDEITFTDFTINYKK